MRPLVTVHEPGSLMGEIWLVVCLTMFSGVFLGSTFFWGTFLNYIHFIIFNIQFLDVSRCFRCFKLKFLGVSACFAPLFPHPKRANLPNVSFSNTPHLASIRSRVAPCVAPRVSSEFLRAVSPKKVNEHEIKIEVRCVRCAPRADSDWRKIPQ